MQTLLGSSNHAPRPVLGRKHNKPHLAIRVARLLCAAGLETEWASVGNSFIHLLHCAHHCGVMQRSSCVLASRHF